MNKFNEFMEAAWPLVLIAVCTISGFTTMALIYDVGDEAPTHTTECGGECEEERYRCSQ